MASWTSCSASPSGQMDTLANGLHPVEKGFPASFPLFVDLDGDGGGDRFPVALYDVAITLGDHLVEDPAELSSGIKRPDGPFHDVVNLHTSHWDAPSARGPTASGRSERASGGLVPD